MRIVFVDNLLLEFRDGKYEFDLQPHLGLISLIAMAEQAGHEGLLYDPKLDLQRNRLPMDATLYKRIADEILSQAPDVVGLTTLGCNFICTVKIAAHLKAARPDMPILLGGPHATILASEILKRFPQFDLIVRHEAEMTLTKVLDSLEQRNFDLIPGVTFRKDGRIVSNPGEPLISDLDLLPWPAFHRCPIAEMKMDSIRVEAGRGCPFHCTFCSTASFFGRKFRLKSAQRIRDEMDFLNANYGIGHFSLTHDLFTVNRKKVIEFCECVASSGYTWSCSARMDCVDEQLLQIMRAAGCNSIYYGIETGSERMQKVIEKNQDLAMVDSILDISQRIGLFSIVSLITGYPQEEQADQDDTLDLVGKLFSRDPALVRPQLHLLTPEPGTKLMADFSHELLYDGHITDFNFPTLEADDAQVMATNPEVFMNHHYFRSTVERERHVFATSMFQLLYELGFPMLRHLLSFYEGRLSRLVADCYNWSKAISRKAIASDDLIDAFVAFRWRRDSYVHSLIRYITAANQLSRRAARESTIASEKPRDAEEFYRLSSRAAILPRLHDCHSILEAISASPDGTVTLSPDFMGQQSDYCVVLELEDPENRTLRNYRLEEGWSQLYYSFQQPQSYKQTVRKLSKFAAVESNAGELLDEMLKCGVLQTSSMITVDSTSIARMSSYSTS